MTRTYINSVLALSREVSNIVVRQSLQEPINTPRLEHACYPFDNS